MSNQIREALARLARKLLVAGMEGTRSLPSCVWPVGCDGSLATSCAKVATPLAACLAPVCVCITTFASTVSEAEACAGTRARLQLPLHAPFFGRTTGGWREVVVGAARPHGATARGLCQPW